MQLKTLLHNFIELKINLEIKGLASNSNNVDKGFLFLAYPGENDDGRNYINDAVNRGASAILYEKDDFKLLEYDIPVIPISNLKDKVGKFASHFYGNPSEKLQIIGVTGTNGKTSTCYYISEILNYLNIKTAIIGTIGYGLPGQLNPLKNTTPGALELQHILSELKDSAFKVVAMEVSSHAIKQNRISDIIIDAGVFTNISQDHLDYHKNMQNYICTKRQFFNLNSLNFASLNLDDIYGAKWLKEISKIKIACSGYSAAETVQRNHGSFFFAENIKSSEKGLTFSIKHKGISSKVKTNILGRFNVDNLLAAISILVIMKHNYKKIITAISKISSVPGRMEVIKNTTKTVVVDYAHTPDALEKALCSLEHHCRKQLICVFGCGGNRDKTKRPLMGQIAEKYADTIILTNDNPRFENPDSIIQDIKSGLSGKKKFFIEADREKAINLAIEHSKRNDIILIAGKGHENYQIINGEKCYFSDADTVKKLLKI